MKPDSHLVTTRRIQQDGQDIQLIELKAVTLRVVAGAGKGRSRAFDTPTIRIGKADDNDLVVRDDSVSRYHVTLSQDEKGIRLHDPGSTNGTFVNGVKVQDALLTSGMRFRLGETEIEVEPNVRQLTAVCSPVSSLGTLVGQSEAMRELYGMIGAVADSSVPVILLGESGTGKEETARTLHKLSGRPGPCVVFDCASTSPELIRTELFGHEAGAYTGAQSKRDGAFRRAHGGTLFIDELGELPLAMQPNLLRVLETREVQPVGSDKTYPVDVRVVTATNRDLRAMVQRGEFREDLYHRVAVIPVRLPGLRDRPEDIPLLVEALAKSQSLDVRFSAEAMHAMQTFAWPGNVRALRNVVTRCGILCRGREVRVQDLGLEELVATGGPMPALPSPTPAGSQSSARIPVPGGAVKAPDYGGKTLADIEREAILSVYEATGHRRREAARRLGININTLRRKLKEYGIGPAEGESDDDGAGDA